MNSSLMMSAQSRSVDAGRGVAWWTEGWALFMRQAGMWVVLGLVLLIVTIVLAIIPILGGLALALLFPVFWGGWMLAARKVEGGGALEIGDLFLGFKDKLTSLIVIGALVLAAVVVVSVVFMVLGAGAAFGMFAGGSSGSAGGAVAGFFGMILMLLVMLALTFVLSMALWFAPALVVFRDLSPVDAVKASFGAALKNIVPFVLYFVIYIVAAIVAAIPFGLGWLVLMPLVLLTSYAAYKDVFGG